jgi:hypothetical protein
MAISAFVPNVYFLESWNFQDLSKNTKSPFGTNIGFGFINEDGKIIARTDTDIKNNMTVKFFSIDYTKYEMIIDRENDRIFCEYGVIDMQKGGIHALFTSKDYFQKQTFHFLLPALKGADFSNVWAVVRFFGILHFTFLHCPSKKGTTRCASLRGTKQSIFLFVDCFVPANDGFYVIR